MSSLTTSKDISLDLKNVKFTSELELAKFAQEDSWIDCDCGHDCCPCDSQCK